MLALVALVLGCEGESGFGDMEQPCWETTPVETDDASLGFDSSDVLALVSTALPKYIDWDENTAGAIGADLELSIAGVADDVAILDERGCYDDKIPPLALFVPLEATLTMAKGDVRADGVLPVTASGIESVDLVLLRPDLGLPATLSGQYEADLAEHIETGSFPDAVIDDIFVVGDESWSAAEIDIEVRTHTDDAFSAQAVWRGHWQL